ncbi:ABC transporter substrate-binding protein [Frankia sp. AgB32]|uniref:ABC transporter substrate-binding protein n=1 Tax=Frankia sp. AgB32 TaxID=631119 RepID=UPI00200D0D4F|nr:ABC transporter substrate-binding protein [Frankia sp. AgB32]MCK9893677.1 ABC transporter substrate-binding protein [Frankia sp. AgB32]
MPVPRGRRASWGGAAAAAVVLSVAVLSASLAGCSSADQVSAAPCGTPGVTDHQIDLGVLIPASGPASSQSEAARAGIDARLGAANAAGGVHGRRVTYQWRDDQGSAEVNGIAARDLVEQRQVFGLIEPTVAAGGSVAYVTQRAIPVTGTALDQAWSSAPTMFAATAVAGEAVDMPGRFVLGEGGHRAVIITTALSSATSTTADYYARSLTAAGVTTAATFTFASGADDPTELARRIAATHADTVIGVLDPRDLIAIVSALRDGNHQPKVVLSATGYNHTLLATYGTRMAGISIPVYYRPFELGGPGVDAYVAAMRRFAPQITQPEQDIAVASYISTDIFLRGLDLASSCPTRAGFVDALRAVNSYDANGLISPISFRPGSASPLVCSSYVQANAAGNAFVVTEPNLCGHPLSA